jgi:A/G-specific adenine glycosylase
MTKSDSLIAKPLLAWYRKHRRILPWRENPDPYGVWISEIMLQQTQVDTVIPYYDRFLERFPTVTALAAAPLEQVLKAWENLGYYTRARNLHQAAKVICEKFKGKIPDTEEAIIALPGIGAYTAGAILSIAFRKPIPAVDGNVRRVLSRLFAIDAPIAQTDTQTAIQALAASLVPKKMPGSFNQALMDLGAIICTPKKPACTDCPLRDLCLARQAGLQDRLPLSSKKPPTPHERVTAAMIRNRRGEVLIVQRPAQGLLASLWKFPGGIVKKGESLSEGLTRSVHEELGLRIQVREQIASINHAYTHFRITLSAFRCTGCTGRPRALACQVWRWALPNDLHHLTFSKADRALFQPFSESFE